jgi:hypothetical protein
MLYETTRDQYCVLVRYIRITVTQKTARILVTSALQNSVKRVSRRFHRKSMVHYETCSINTVNSSCKVSRHGLVNKRCETRFRKTTIRHNDDHWFFPRKLQSDSTEANLGS